MCAIWVFSYSYRVNWIINFIVQYYLHMNTYSYEPVSCNTRSCLVQVATISVYGFFVLALLSRQLLDPRQTAEQTLLKDPLHAIDMYVPVPTLLQLLLYVGWLKVSLPISSLFSFAALLPRTRKLLECHWFAGGWGVPQPAGQRRRRLWYLPNARRQRVRMHMAGLIESSKSKAFFPCSMCTVLVMNSWIPWLFFDIPLFYCWVSIQ